MVRPACCSLHCLGRACGDTLGVLCRIHIQRTPRAYSVSYAKVRNAVSVGVRPPQVSDEERIFGLIFAGSGKSSHASLEPQPLMLAARKTDGVVVVVTDNSVARNATTAKDVPYIVRLAPDIFGICRVDHIL